MSLALRIVTAAATAPMARTRTAPARRRGDADASGRGTRGDLRARAPVQRSADHDHREDADRSVEYRDGHGVVLSEPEARGQDVHHRDLDEAEAGGRQRH